ncbi:hypothetical protein RvY_04204 [Ramazzottius varieornatus]|uniref:Sodium/potassium-transporting ATPase subunit beta n=1 Tax=Ramazzottius varieornatus TaxID=947166 RepID=A0A1D1UUD3_RAMVA|nr:hypothetical protein RvY_04204 [Ramazzottius varieornatus]
MTVIDEKTTDGLAIGGNSKPPPKGKMESFMEFMYDSKQGTVMGRTGISWLQIIAFYIFFYCFLAGFFSSVMVLFLQTLDVHYPARQLKHSKLGVHPGMGFRPHPTDFESSLIWIKTGDRDDQTKARIEYTKGLNDYFEGYNKNYETASNMTLEAGQRPVYVDCSLENPNKPDHTLCKVDLNAFGSCGNNTGYGYNIGQPCVLLKLNRIVNWLPESFDLNDPNTPKELKDWVAAHLSNTTMPTKNQVYVTCDGEDLVDQEKMGQVSLHPPSISASFFPYTNQPFYLSPVVMIQFHNPERGVMIDVVCKAWAKRIERNVNQQLGAVRFSILVDRP